ncbi:MAG TPA: LLM class flavin-dependent oxidoreductase [Gammaproteobacteria bacterium]|nr:LLM class flavin-dependent oxidoreductase [Gammaproteobacteria bacterium]
MKTSVFSVTDHYPEGQRSLAEFYAQIVDEIVYAEELGFANYFVAEHHFHEYGVVAAPDALLAAAAAGTRRIGLGVAAAILPFHNPLLVAERYAQLDQLSHGRLALGVGSGYLRHEFDGFRIGPWEKRFRFDEALEVLTRAWRGEPFSYHGLYHHVDNTRLAITPYQKPQPPLWVAVLRAEAAYHVGRQGRNIMLMPYATCDTIRELEEVITSYRAGRRDAGFEGPGDVAVGLHTYVSGSAAATREEVEPALDLYVRTRLYAKRRSYDELDRAGLALFGDGAEVTRRLRALQDTGLTQVMILTNFGDLPGPAVQASMRRFAEEVMPAVQDREPPGRAANSS